MEKKYFGAMIDMSRNAVMKIEKLKEFVSYISSFGYNMLQLYTEDTYEIDGEPKFGYLRGRYTSDELKDLDSFCKEKGVELIPCIQTLAHVNQIFRWKEYGSIRDCDDILLAENERTYELIENMFKSISKSFTSRLVNIGMDEAHMVGLGKYLSEHGFQNRFDIINRHLKKVIEIASKYGFKPMMWSDMFFRLANNGDYYGDKMTEQAKNAAPKGVDLIYWDYYHTTYKDYKRIIDAHKKFDNDIWFAGGAWCWEGFAPMNSFTLKTMLPAMDAIKDGGIENIFITLWGDDGRECSPFGLLPSLFAIKKYYDGEKDMEIIKSEFKKLTGENFDAMFALDLPNKVNNNKGTNNNPCKYMLFNDLFLGFLDSTVNGGEGKKYKRYANILKKYGENSKFKYIFNQLYSLCDVLSVKYELGVKLRENYKNKDKVALSKNIKDLEKLVKKLKIFYNYFEELWMTDNKPNGFEVQQTRIGGLILRTEYCKKKLVEYVSGKTDCISELEENILDYEKGGKEFNKKTISYNLFNSNVSTSVL